MGGDRQGATAQGSAVFYFKISSSAFGIFQNAPIANPNRSSYKIYVVPMFYSKESEEEFVDEFNKIIT